MIVKFQGCFSLASHCLITQNWGVCCLQNQPYSSCSYEFLKAMAITDAFLNALQTSCCVIYWVEIKVFLLFKEQEYQLPHGKYVQFRKRKLSALFLQCCQPLVLISRE